MAVKKRVINSIGRKKRLGKTSVGLGLNGRIRVFHNAKGVKSISVK